MAAVRGLQDVAIQDDGTLSESSHIHYGAQGTADEPLNLMGASADFSAFAFAWCPGQCCSWKHSVFRRNPSSIAVAKPTGDARFNGGITEHTRCSKFNQNRTFSGLNVMGG
jgi:hypothetical protein